MIYEIINMNEWKTKQIILKELKEKGVILNERAFRKIVENINKMYAKHEIDKFIAHSNKGYKISTNEEEIRKSAMDYRKRGVDQIVKSAKILKALGENTNFNLVIKNGEFIYAEV